MFSWLKNVLRCFRPARRYSRMNRDRQRDGIITGEASSSTAEAFLWCQNLERHPFGDLSFAVAQANQIIEDHSQVEIGNDAVFVGVYDGHGGADASRFVAQHLFPHFIRLARDNGGISVDTLRGAFAATEEEFMGVVRRGFEIKPLIAAVGSCCLVGVISRGTLFTANLGDSRAVLGSLGRSNKIVAEQLTREHNASFEEVREELRSLHPDDPRIVMLKQGVWRVKGIIQISRSIGDAFLKSSEYALDSSHPRFYLREPIRRPVLSAEPSITSRVLRPNDKFVIFASDGLWEHLSNQDAVRIVHEHPRAGIAGRLVRTAISTALRKNEMVFDRLGRMEGSDRRAVHDDITVVVMFIDYERLGAAASVQNLSIRGFVDSMGTSNFSTLH